MSGPTRAVVLRARALSPSVREVTLDAGAGFPFVPGQWINVYDRSGGTAEPLKRSYSIASPRRPDGTLDLAITLVPGGPMSTLLHAVSPGDALEISHAQGFFTMIPPRRSVLWIATGTGVAPFRAMAGDLEMRTEAMEDGLRFELLFGARSEAELLYRDEWSALAQQWPGFAYTPTLSRGDEAWQGRRGYVQAHLAERVEALGGAANVDVYVCGLQKMVGDVRKLLRDLGVAKDRIHHERYD
jgi:ferredoxin-NADP reductase